MSDANTQFFVLRKSLFAYFNTSPWGVLNHFIPALRDKVHVVSITERLIEYPFIHENIPFNGRSNILDVGSGSTTLPFELAGKGYKVWAFDLKTQYRKGLRHERLTFVEGDIRQTNFPRAFFDIVTAVSSIEHIGFDGDSINPQGDKKALQELARILKPGGKLLMTVPFGRRGIYSGSTAWDANRKGRPLFRVHDLRSLEELLGHFEIEKMEFGLRREGGWAPATLKEVEEVDSLSQPKWYSSKVVAMVVARKPPRHGE